MLVSIFKLLFQVLVDVITAEENCVKWANTLKYLIENGILDSTVIEKAKLSLRQITTTGAMDAPQAGDIDEAVKQAIKNTGMENIPLPGITHG